VYLPEYRLSTHALYPAAVNDIMVFLHWLKDTQMSIKGNNENLHLIGFSAGAQLASLVAQYPNVPIFYDNVIKTIYPKYIHSLILMVFCHFYIMILVRVKIG
ncbi:MAG TPA: alpha/beta hydrolase, partial [Saprospiraceae bacterium]|nr:alpha/beta hydrolase [Saprospiraceae bacterium]